MPEPVIVLDNVHKSYRGVKAVDGIGFDVAATSTTATDHYGIRGMRERAASIGAQLEIKSIPGSGTIVRVSLS